MHDAHFRHGDDWPGCCLGGRLPMERLLGEPEIERAVLAYLAECPNAMDTFEGIAFWWIRLQQIRFEMEALTRVLDRLTDRGVLERMESRSEERTLYRLKSR